MDPMDIHEEDNHLLQPPTSPTSASPGPETSSDVPSSPPHTPQQCQQEDMDIIEEDPPAVIPEEVTLDSDSDDFLNEDDDDDDEDDIIPLPTQVDPRGAVYSSSRRQNQNLYQQQKKAHPSRGGGGPGPAPGSMKPRFRPARIPNNGEPPQVIDLTEDEEVSVLAANHDDDDDDLQDITEQQQQVPSSSASARNSFRPATAKSAKGPSLPTQKVKDDDDDDTPELIEVDPVPLSKEKIAEEKKKLGNDHFKLGQYYQALAMYTQAIEAMPTEASYYGNRSACNMMIKKYKEALADIRMSLQLDPSYEKGYLRLIRTTLYLGNIKECELAFETVKKLNLMGKIEAKAEHDKLQWLKRHLVDIESCRVKGDHRKLIYLIGQALEVATADNGLKMMKADALVKLGRHPEAQELCTEVLQNDQKCAEAMYIRALCLYLEDNWDKALQFVKQGLQYEPDSAKMQGLFKGLRRVKEKREEAGSKYGKGLWEDARKDYEEVLAFVGADGEMVNVALQSKVNFNLALIACRQGNLDLSITLCSRAIDLNPKYLKAIIHRAKLHTQKELHDEAVHDYEAAIRLDPSLKHLKRELTEAKMAAKRAKRKDYYKILQVDKTATEDEIRKAYKKRALLHHPDRHANATETVKKEQEKLFKDLGEAYEVLSDSKKRFRYDQGVDLMGDGGGGYGGGFDGGFDPSGDFINVFFGNSGIPSFRPGAGGPGGSGCGGRGPHQFHHTFRH